MDISLNKWEKETLLIADDDRYSHILTEKLLAKTGIKILHAYNGSDAIDILLSKKDISIALIDIRMPVFNGVQVIEKVKSECPQVVFIAYTADCINYNKEICSMLGFTDCIIKPVTVKKMIASIEDILCTTED